MSDEGISSKEGNGYIFDAESPTELARLINQGRMITRSMGGPLAEQEHPEQFRTVLDLGCGPGDWVLDVAFAYPGSTVCGVDISHTMVDYANARARTQRLSNASFGLMDICQPLDFSDESFDLINGRLLLPVLQRQNWPGLISECKRLLKPGGILRLTEPDGGHSSSQSSERILALGAQYMYQAGYGFSREAQMNSFTATLSLLLGEAGFGDVESKAQSVKYSPYDENYPDARVNLRLIATQMRPLLIKAGLITEKEFDRLYQQMEIEMLADDFYGVWSFLTIWGANRSS